MKLRAHRRAFTAAEIELVDSRIRASTHAKAQGFIFDDARYISLLCNRGAGKTLSELFRIVRAMMRGDPATKKGANCLYIVKTRETARGLIWSDLNDLLIERLGWSADGPKAIVKFDQVRSEVTLCNGSSLRLFGFDEWDEIEKLRGKTWHEVVIDEVGSSRDDLLKRLIEDVVGFRLVGSLVLGGTPGYTLEGVFYEATRAGSPAHRPWSERKERASDGWRWSSHSFSTLDGVEAGIAAIAELHRVQLEEKRLNGYSDSNPKWLREGMGQWAQDNTTSVYVYRARDEQNNEFNQWTPAPRPEHSTRWARLPPGYDPKKWGWALAMDIGWKDAFALEAFAWSYDDPTRTMWHIGEFYKTKQPTRAVATMLLGDGLNAQKPGGIIGELGWPDFMVADFSGAGDRFIDDVRVDYGLLIKAVDKHPKYKDPAIEIVNADMFEGRFRILAGSMLAKELVALQWVMDRNGKRLENPTQPNHGCDAMLYFRVSVTPLLPAVTAPAQPNVTPAAEHAPQVSRAAPAPKVDADGWSTDVEGWSSGEEMEGATEGAW